MPRPRVFCLGAGALGSLFAAHASRHLDLALLPQRSVTAPQHRVELTGRQGEQQAFSLPVRPASDLRPGDWLWVFTKSYDTLSALESLAESLAEPIHTVLFQNGLGAHERVQQRFTQLPLYAATTTEGAHRPAKHHIVHAGQGQTWVGPLNAEASDATAQQMAQWLAQAGFASAAEAHIRQRLWDKLAINCCINPFTLVLNCHNGEIRGQPYFETRKRGLCEEIAGVMQALGFATDAETLLARVEQVLAGTADNISSMLQDHRAGRRTEIDDINGHIQRVAQSLGHEMPINEALIAAVLSKTEGATDG